jgi:hypothetical protein
MIDYSDSQLRDFYINAFKCPYIQNSVQKCPFLKKHVDMCPWLTTHANEKLNIKETENTLSPLTTSINEHGLLVPDPSAFYRHGRKQI